MKTRENLPENLKRIVVKEHFTFDDLVDIIRFLRSPDGCPWDREQTHDSIEICLIEEAYELIDAVKKRSAEKMTEEAGDVMLQSVFHAVMGEEEGTFTMQEVIDAECVKMITRHTHIFGAESVKDSAGALKAWEKNKYKEKHLESAGERVKDVPETLPALLRAEKVQKRAAKFNFDFANVSQAVGKLEEEIGEFQAALAEKDEKRAAEEGGDLLFAAVNVLRLAGVESERALAAATEKFIERFLRTEELAKADGREMATLSAEETDIYYNEAKKR